MSDMRGEYLNEMGIEVWRLRSELPSQQGSVERLSSGQPNVDQSLEPAQVDHPPAKAVSPKAPVPKFLFCFLDYDSLSLLFSLPSNSISLPADYRVFADDINLALFGKKIIPRTRDLRWPMVQAAHIQQTKEDAREVVLQKVKQSRERLIVFGVEVLTYIAESRGQEIGQSLEIQGKKVLLVNDVQHYFDEAHAKKQLWQHLHLWGWDRGYE